MRKTVLLVFIHGFKGGDDTFGTFPEHIKALVGHALPGVNILAVQYPQFETRGELKDCVGRFREWLENKVIDLEVANCTPSPTVEPSVHTILVGHSMGGIVAAEALLLLASEQPVPASSAKSNVETPNFPSNTTLGSSTGTSHPNPVKDHNDSGPTLMFPHVQGVLAFDTPYLGLAPEMVAHSLEGGHKLASGAWETANEVASVFGWGPKAEAGATKSPSMSKSVGALPAPPPASVKNAVDDAAATPKWQNWGRYAMFAGAAGAVAAGGAAALYSQRERISAGWGWATSHLLFVGDLAKAEVLKKRVEKVETVVEERGLGGFVNMYTNLGRGAREGYGITENLVGKERTFCNVPNSAKEANEKPTDSTNTVNKTKLRWIKAVNEKAKDETAAHMSIFFPRDNPGFYTLSEKTVEVLTSFVDNTWYKSSDGPATSTSTAEKGDLDGLASSTDQSGEKAKMKEQVTSGSLGKDWEGLDEKDVRHAVGDDVEMRDEDGEGGDMLEDSVIIENIKGDGDRDRSGVKELESEWMR